MAEPSGERGREGLGQSAIVLAVTLGVVAVLVLVFAVWKPRGVVAVIALLLILVVLVGGRFYRRR